MSAQRSPLSLALLYAISGFCTLALETLWMRMISLWAGNTVVASALVLVVFFLAAAAGNAWGARLTRRSTRPLGYYGLAEMAAGLASIATFFIGRWLWQNPGAFPCSWNGQGPATLLLVGPPAFLGGIAFPSLAETFVRSADHRTASSAPFYGLNLLGAALGVLAGSVWLPWSIGIAGGFVVTSALQAAAGFIAWRLSIAISRPSPSAPDSPSFPPFSLDVSPAKAWLVLIASGVLSLATQSLLIVWARQIVGGSVYVIAGVLATFIAGLGLGALASARWRRRGYSPLKLLMIFASLSALCLFVMPDLGTWLVQRKLSLTGGTPSKMLVQFLAASAPILLPLTFCLGIIFPVAWELVKYRASYHGGSLGSALAANKLGAALGSLIGLFVLLPGCGPAGAILCLGGAYLLVAVLICASTPCPRLLVTVVGALAILGITQSLRSRGTTGMKPHLRLLAEYHGPYGPVAVVENRDTGSRQIVLNSRQRLSGTGHAMTSQQHQSWVPLLFCRQQERVLTIGMAAGLSATAALDWPVRELHAVELVPEVVRAAREQFSKWNGPLFHDSRAQIHSGDGRVVLSHLPGQFDAIVCDLFFPEDDGTANLYSRDFFIHARNRLSPGGVFCLWLPCYQHTAGTAGSVIRTFGDVFPSALLIRANFDPIQPVIGLLGATEPLPVGREFLDARLSTPPCRALATRSPFFRSPENAWLLLAGDLHAAEPDFQRFPATTDDRPLFAYVGSRPPPDRERLVGMAFLDWIGRRFVRPLYPSCSLGHTAPEEVLGGLRAANMYFAAAIAQSVIPGDTRPESLRLKQVSGYLERAHALHPDADFPRDSLGK